MLTEGAALTQKMLLFPNGDRAFDGTNNAVLSGFNTTTESGVPEGVTLIGLDDGSKLSGLQRIVENDAPGAEEANGTSNGNGTHIVETSVGRVKVEKVKHTMRSSRRPVTASTAINW